MLITRECDYAVRALMALSTAPRLSINEICEKEAISSAFTYKIIKKLQKANMVKVFRGVQGGFSLNIPLSELTLYDVYTVINPELFIVECVDPNFECPLEKKCESNRCFVRNELCDIQQELCNLLKRKTLQEILY